MSTNKGKRVSHLKKDEGTSSHATTLMTNYRETLKDILKKEWISRYYGKASQHIITKPITSQKKTPLNDKCRRDFQNYSRNQAITKPRAHLKGNIFSDKNNLQNQRVSNTEKCTRCVPFKQNKEMHRISDDDEDMRTDEKGESMYSDEDAKFFPSDEEDEGIHSDANEGGVYNNDKNNDISEEETEVICITSEDEEEDDCVFDKYNGCYNLYDDDYTKKENEQYGTNKMPIGHNVDHFSPSDASAQMSNKNGTTNLLPTESLLFDETFWKNIRGAVTMSYSSCNVLSNARGFVPDVDEAELY